MNCLVLSGTFPSRLSPWLGTYNRRQMECLARLCRLTLVNPLRWTWFVKGRVPWALAKGSDDVLEGIELFHPVLWHLPGMATGRTWHAVVKAAKRALADGQERRFDLVMGTFGYPYGYAARQLAGEMGLPYAVKVRGSDLHSLPATGSVREHTAEALRDADAVVAVSSNLAEIARELGAPPERVHLLTNGIDADAFTLVPREEARAQLGLDPARRLVLYVGYLRRVKGIDILVDSLDAGAPGFPAEDTDVVIAGQGPLQWWMRRRLRGRPPGRVRMLGHIGRKEVALYMNAADVFVLPSRNEGCPNVVLEALCCGTPVAAARVGAVPDLLDEGCGVISEPQNPRGLAEAIGRALGTEWDRAAIRARVEGMSWQANAQRLHDILRNIVSEERR